MGPFEQQAHFRDSRRRDERCLLPCVGLAICLAAFVGLPRVAWPDQTATTSKSADSLDRSLHRRILRQYCLDCHGDRKPEAEFRVQRLLNGEGDSIDLGDKQQLALRQKALQQLKSGAMPPKGKPRPSDEQLRALTQWLGDKIAGANAEDSRNAGPPGRAVMRRLNRTEYQNTVRDLLGVNVDLDGVLPVDMAAGGFDTSAENLHFSSYQLSSYLTAANQAIEAAFAGNQRPQRVKRRIDPKNEISTRRKDVYRHLDDGVAVFGSDLASNIQIVFWNFLTRRRGKYRVRISAYAYQTDEPLLFHINGGTNNLGDPPYLIDYFEAPPGKPTVIEFEEQMEAGRNIRLLVDTKVRPRDLARDGGAADYAGPGLVVQWVEIEGPLDDDWPPPGYRRLCGELPQAPVPGQPGLYEAVSQQPLVDAEAILKKFIRRAFRRAVTKEDIKPYLNRVQNKLDEGYSFERALRVGFQAVLVSPEFLFHHERIRPIRPIRPIWPNDTTESQRGASRLDDFSLASRLSYFLWSSMPDDELLTLADQSALNRPQVLRQQVERMLEDAKAQAFTKNFAGQWLGLRDLDATLPDRQLYPEYDRLLRYSMPKEATLFFEEVLKNDLSLTNFVSSDFSLLNGRLADHYGIAGVQGLAFRKVALPPNSHRGGFLTMAAILKVTANGTTTSPIIRGSWVLDRILGAPPARPPAGVEAVDSDIRGATTIREQLALHRQVTTCAVCHVEIDPPGFALENFDVIGGWREHYRSIGQGEPVTLGGKRMRYKNGPLVDASDVLPDGRAFRDIDEYKQLLLADKDQLSRALAEKLLSFATGVRAHGTSATGRIGDRSQIEAIVKSVRKKNYGFRSLVHEVVQSEIFLSK